LDNTRFYQLKIDLVNSMAMGQIQFPMTIVEMQHLLNNYKMPLRRQHVKEPDNDGVSSMQNGGNPVPPKIGTIKCWHHYGKKSHYKSNCSRLQVQELDVGVQNLSVDICKEAHHLVLANEGWVMVQEEEKGKNGVQGILLEHHV
jgi:hypothetical protein